MSDIPVWYPVFGLTAMLALGLHNQNKEKKAKKAVVSARDALLHDTSRPEAVRRKELLRALGAEGATIMNQSVGFVQYKSPKKPFSLGLFIVLALCFIFPAVVYLIWYATQKEIVASLVIDEV